MAMRLLLLLLTFLLSASCVEKDDRRTPTEEERRACMGVDGWRCPKLIAPPDAGPSSYLFVPLETEAWASGGSSPIIPASWTVPAWFLDPNNCSGTASDGNSCTSLTTACLTYAEISVHRWGTVSPIQPQNTTFSVMSLSTSSTELESDPVVYTPIPRNQAFLHWTGVLGGCTIQSFGTLTGIVPKVRSTKTQFQVAVSALDSGSTGVTGGELMVNLSAASHDGGVALQSTDQAMIVGTTSPYEMDQPLTYFYSDSGTANPPSPPCNSSTTGVSIDYPVPCEDDTWQNGDAYQVHALPGMNFVKVEPQMSDPTLNGSPSYVPLQMDQLTFYTPSTLSLSGVVDGVTVQNGVVVKDCQFQKALKSHDNQGYVGSRFLDDFFTFGFDISGTSLNANSTTPDVNNDGYRNFSVMPTIFGGNTVGVNTQASISATNVWLDFDFLLEGLGSNVNPIVLQGTALWGCINAKELVMLQNGFAFPFQYGACPTVPIFWGSGGRIQTEGVSRWVFQSPALDPVNGFQFFASTMKLNGGSTTGCQHTGASPDVINCGKTVNAGVLDDGGTLYLWGGGSISNNGF